MTWRLFDDKDLQVADEFEIKDSSDGQVWAQAVITEVIEKRLVDMTDKDFEFSQYDKESPEELVVSYRKIYGDKVNLDTMVKMIKFELIS